MTKRYLVLAIAGVVAVAAVLILKHPLIFRMT